MSSDSQPAARGAAPLALLPASSKPAKSVTYVAGLKCYLCLRSLKGGAAPTPLPRAGGDDQGLS